MAYYGDFDDREARYLRDREFLRREQSVPRECTIETLFHLARRDPTINTFLAHWRMGRITLENALIGMVTNLHSEKMKYASLATQLHATCTTVIPQPAKATPAENREEQERKRAAEQKAFYDSGLGVPHDVLAAVMKAPDDKTKTEVLKHGWNEKAQLPKELEPPECDEPVLIK